MPSKEKREKFSKQINKDISSILKDDFNTTLVKASNIELGDAFTKYYVEQYLKGLYNLDEDELNNGLAVGGPNDLDIDFIYEATDHFIVVQCKYRSKTNIDSSDINKFTDLFKNTLFNAEAASLGNERIKDYLYAVRQNKNKKSIIMEFVYNKRFTNRLIKRLVLWKLS